VRRALDNRAPSRLRSDHDRVTARPDRSELGVMSLRLRLCLPVVCSRLRRGQRLALPDTNSLAVAPLRIVGCGLQAEGAVLPLAVGDHVIVDMPERHVLRAGPMARRT
jgi:hypothetical protein